MTSADKQTVTSSLVKKESPIFSAYSISLAVHIQLTKMKKMRDCGCKPQYRTDYYDDYSFLSIAFPFLSRQSLEDNSMVQPT